MLVLPPQGDPCQPYSSIPYLSATLRQAGHEVKPVDLNLLAYQYFTDISSLSQSYEQCSRIFNKLNARAQLDSSEFNKYRYFARTFVCGPSVIARLSEALSVFKDEKEFYDPNRYAWALRTVQRALEIASGPFYPSNFSLQGYSMRYSQESSAGILNAINDEKENMFIDFYKSKFFPVLNEEVPEILGVSVTYQTHIIPAFTLAHIVKQQYPSLPILFGGAAISRMFNKMKLVPKLLHNVDYMIIYEGETALLMLVDALDSNNPLSKLPNLIIIDGEKISETGVRHIECLEDLPCPDFDGLFLDQYWAPEIVPLLNISRGCYWGKCAFCTFSPSTWGPNRKGFRSCSTDKIINNINLLSDKYNFHCFNFAIDAMPPAKLLKIADVLIRNNIKITWDSEVRLEEGFTSSTCRKLYDSGCRHLRFGFETACDRVGRLMNKGNNLSTTQEIIKNCSEAGIAVCLMAFVGFPGETAEEAEMTAEFLVKNSHSIPFVALGEFILEDGSMVIQNPEMYGIKKCYSKEADDLATKYHYEVSSGMTQEEIQLVFDSLDEHIAKTYTNRDLHIVGGQGHCHTSLYVSHYDLDFILSISHQKQKYKGNSLSMDSIVLSAEGTRIVPIRFDIKNMETLLIRYAFESIDMTSPSLHKKQVSLDPSKNFMVYQPEKPDYFIYLASDIAEWAFSFDGPIRIEDLIYSGARGNGMEAIHNFVRYIYALIKLVDCEILSVI